MPVRILGSLVAGILVLAVAPAAQSPIALADVLKLAAEYHSAYAPRVSGTTLEERYTLIPVSGGQMATPIRFTSDLVVLNVNGTVIALRDPFAVDNVPLRERTPRITALLEQPTVQGWDRAQSFAAEQHFRFLFDLIIALNDPTLALQFIAGDAHLDATYKLERIEKMNGVEVAKVGFKEIVERGEKGRLRTRGNAVASGRFWIETGTGAVQKSELWATASTEAVVINVTYTKGPLGMWLPEKMNETYDWKEIDDVASNRGVGAYGARLSFQAKAAYSNARYTPIDLSKMR